MLPGDWHRLTVGGNVYWQSGAYDFSKALRLTVNLNNVLDKTYYSGMGNYNSVFHGAPRNALAQMRYTF
ncbi:TonB-dependent receptor [Achromobacter insuavis]|uniref:TonB-dependent receptor n=1 Tax=Achromobacter insuavis TaxID=1287735 RepID=UPI001F13D799